MITRVFTLLLPIPVLLCLLLACEPAPPPKDIAENHILVSQNYLKNGQIKAAHIEAKNAVKLAPNNVQAILALIETLMIQDAYQDALEQLTKGLKLSPQHPTLMVLLAKAQLKLNLYEHSLDTLKQIETTNSADNLTLLHADALVGLNQLQQAKNLLIPLTSLAETPSSKITAEQTTTTQENSTAAQIRLAKIYFEENQFDEALGWLENALKQNPKSIEGLILQGNYELRQQRFQDAEHSFSKALLQMREFDIITHEKYLALNGMIESLVAQNKTKKALSYSEILAASPRTKIMSDYQLAMKRFQQGDISAAESELKTLIDTSPRIPTLQTAMGLVKLSKGQLETAEAHLSEAMSGKIYAHDAHKLLALTQIKLGKIAEAQQSVDAGLKNRPLDVNLLTIKAAILLQTGDLEESHYLLQKANNQQPQHPRLRLVMAHHAFQSQDYPLAEKRFTALLLEPEIAQAALKGALLSRHQQNLSPLPFLAKQSQLHPQNTALHWAHVSALSAAKDFEQAILVAKDRQTIFPNRLDVALIHATAYASRAQHLFKVDAESALEDCEKALSIFPHHLSAMQLKINILAQSQQADAALIYLEKQKSRFEHNLDQYHLMKGDILMQQGTWNQARTAYQSSWSVEPSAAAAQKYFLATQKLLGPHSSSTNLTAQWAQKRPNSLAAQMGYAISLQESGQTALAKAQYEICLELDPQQVTALNNLAWLLAESLYSLPKAENLAKQAIKLAPDNLNVLDTLGWIQLQQNKLAEAAKNFSTALDHRWHAPQEIINRYVATLQRLGNVEKATYLQTKFMMPLTDQNRLQKNTPRS